MAQHQLWSCAPTFETYDTILYKTPSARDRKLIKISNPLMDALGSIGVVTGAIGAPLAAVSVPNSAVASSTAAVSLAQGTAAQQNSNKESSGATSTGADLKDDPRLEKFTLIAHCSAKSSVKNQVDGRQVFLRNKKASTLRDIFIPPD